MKRAGQTFYREQIASDFSQAEFVPPEHVADRLGRPIDILRCPFNRLPHEFFVNRIKYGFRLQGGYRVAESTSITQLRFLLQPEALQSQAQQFH